MLLCRIRRLEEIALCGAGSLVLVLFFSFNQIYVPLHLANQQHFQWNGEIASSKGEYLQPDDVHSHEGGEHHHHGEKEDKRHEKHSAADHLCLLGTALPSNSLQLFLFEQVSSASEIAVETSSAVTITCRNRGPPSYF